MYFPSNFIVNYHIFSMLVYGKQRSNDIIMNILQIRADGLYGNIR